MPHPPARFTEAELKRALKAARQIGDDMAVRVCPDGSIEVYRRPPQDKPLAFAGEVKL